MFPLLTIFSLVSNGINAQCSVTGFSPNSLTFTNEGGRQVINLQFDNFGCSETITFNNVPSWLTLNRFNNTTIEVLCEVNSGTQRTILIDFTYGNGMLMVLPVTQEATCLKNWYPDGDGDGFGDPSGEPQLSCTSPGSGWVNNNNDQCPLVSGTDQGCPVGEVPEDFNYTTSIAYDIQGNVKASAKSYFDLLGRPTQNQTLDIKTNKIWATQVLYDSQGRPAFSTLSAPVGTGDFEFKTDFIKKGNGTVYSTSDFEASPDNPATVGSQANTLGWYYSNSNTSEPYQDVTSYPFVRAIYSELNPGTTLKTIGGNKINGTWRQGYTFSMPASQELSQTIAFGETKYNTVKTIKTIVRDVHGVENVVFTDTDGKTLAAARSGGSSKRTMSVAIGEQGYVDIHVPKGSNMGFTVSSSAVTVYNLISETTTTASSSLPNGFYRVAVNNPDTYTPNSITVTYKENYYDYSLNEYDKAGRLIASYQPYGSTKSAKPVTTYTYNALGQLVYTKGPDEGESWFKYRKDGQIRYSQNSKQKDAGEYSYTNYDNLGRPEESGVLIHGGFSTVNPDAAIPAGTRKEQQYTVYDAMTSTDISALPTNYKNPKFLASNVAKTYNKNTSGSIVSTSYYSYDIYGRVEWIVQNIAGLGKKTINYEYDPVSGNVTKVIYQKYNSADRFVHRYTYNEADQLVKVETSKDNSSFTTQADYEYYETGALKRTNIANGLQGVDYVYNLSGQLKSVNHPSLSSNKDPGGDANDIFGMAIDYHRNDYMRNVSNINATTYGTDQYNGNIKGVRWNNKYQPLSGAENAYMYHYNRNNWLTGAEYGQYSTPTNTSVDANITNNNVYSSGTTTLEATNSITLKPGFHAQSGSTFTAKIVDIDGFKENSNGDYDVYGITYDANGNIQKLNRNKNTVSGSNDMDKLSYSYKSGKPNQLDRVSDAVGTVADTDDIESQASGNYMYNTIGQLIENKEEGIKYVYNASGLVTEVQKNNVPLVKFFYNDRGHRVKKESYTNGSLTKTTFYVRDVSGSTMAIYDGNTIKENPIYGGNRLGVYYRGSNTSLYQITDHLGNVRALVGTGSAIPKGATDYYPFGMVMPNRNLDDAEGYRYAYQGQEKDDETGKEAFELRLWDSRIGRWTSPDPYGQYSSPYVGMGNDPVNGIDPDGGWRFRFIARWARNKAIKAGLNPGELYESNGEWGFNTSSGYSEFEGGSLVSGTSVTFNYTDAWKNNSPNLITTTSKLQNFQFWRNKAPKNNVDALAHIGVEISFGSIESMYSVFSGGKKFGGEQLQGYHRTNEGVLGIVDMASLGFTKTARMLKAVDEVKSTPMLWNNYQKATRGVFPSRRAAADTYKIRIENLNYSIRIHNKNVNSVKAMEKAYSNMGNIIGVSDELQN